LKKIQKASKGFFRDQGILHHLLKINDLDSLMIHPTAGTSFEAFIIEEIIRGIQCTLEPGIDFHYYRTRDRSEIDLIIEAPFGLVPIEIKLGYKISKRNLFALNTFLKDTQTPFGILVNNSKRIELLTDKIIQIPATCF
jgi:predicted AAA+ superfamily ATPase